MSYAIAAGAIIEVQRRQLLHDQQVINTFHYRAADSIIDGTLWLDEMLALWETAIHEPWRALQAFSVNNSELWAQVVYPVRYVGRVRIPANPGGGEGTQALPSGASLVVRRKTDLADYKHRGRIFVPGLPVAATAASKFDDTWLATNAATFSDKMVVAFVPGTEPVTAQPVIWSYGNPAGAQTITQGYVDPIIRYQRRREIGKGV